MKESKSIRDQIELWLMLVFLTSLGWPLGLILSSFFVHAIGVAPESIFSLIVAGMFGGVIVNLLGMFVLRKSVQSMGTWLLSATLGWVLGLIGTSYTIQVTNSTTGWIIGGALGGLIYGFIQRFGFKPGFRKGYQWVLLHGFGWASAYGFGIALPPDLRLNTIEFSATTHEKSKR